MESVGVLVVTAFLGLGDVSAVSKSAGMLVADPQPDTGRARSIDPQPGDFAFLRTVKGRTRGEVLRQLGHPGRVERAPDGTEQWTYSRTDGKLFWVFFREGRALQGIPTDGVQLGGVELRW
jgi:hypothetical protein